MPFRDVRQFIARLEKEGEALQIKEEVDWNLEAGAMLRRAYEQGLPAPFFQKVKDYPAGYTMFGGPLGTHRRVALAMDMAADTHPAKIIEEYLRRKQQPIKPVLVKTGPCKENIYIGDKVDLLKFPAPMIHEGDGGRYIGTFHLTAVKDLDSEWVNWSTQRHMVHDKNTIGIEASPHTHFGLIFMQRYEPRGKRMEVAIAIGTEPISALCAASPMPYGVSEVDIIGGIRGEPLELVKCETVDLAVPATSEIVIEGELIPNERRDEGPFGEFTGYMATLRGPRPVIHVKAVTHRDNPILTMTCEGIPTTDSQIIKSIANSSEVLEVLRARGLPVTMAYLVPESGGMCVAVAIKPPFANVAEDISHVVWATRVGRSTPYVMVFDDDVDPTNLSQVFHALITKCHPYRGITRLEHAVGILYSPWANEYERRYRVGGRVYFDCTWPLDWTPSIVPKKSAFDKIYPVDIQQKALAKWQKYGY